MRELLTNVHNGIRPFADVRLFNLVELTEQALLPDKRILG